MPKDIYDKFAPTWKLLPLEEWRAEGDKYRLYMHMGDFKWRRSVFCKTRNECPDPSILNISEDGE